MKRKLGAFLVVLWIQFFGVWGQMKVDQSPSVLNLQEGESAMLECNWSSSTTNLQWLTQNPGEGPVSLFFIASGVKQKGRFIAKMNLKDRRSSLHINNLQRGDSTTYLCAVETGNYQLHFGQGTKLTVKANIQNPQPALYQLRSPKSSNTSVCLLTDFGFYNGSIKNETVTGSEATVLEMMTMESKSYGAVTWGSKSNFTCTDAFRKDMFDFNQFSGSKCNSSHAEQGFETDRDLNLMNLSLIVLRIIFLKTVGFNLLMTLRLWSN